MTEPHQEADTGSTPPEPSTPDAAEMPVPEPEPEATAPEPTAPETIESAQAEPSAPEPVESTTPEPSEPTPPETPPPPVTGWVAPEGGGSGGGRRRGCLIAVIIVGAFLFLGFIGLVFLGSQARNILGGTVQFGTGGTGCSVTGTATTFPASSSIRSVAFLKEDITAGTTLTTIVTFADGTSESSDQTLDTTAGCVTQAIEPGLAPGHYGLEYRVGTETVAKGGFDVTP